MMRVFKILCWLHEPGRQKGKKNWKPDVKQREEEEGGTGWLGSCVWPEGTVRGTWLVNHLMLLAAESIGDVAHPGHRRWSHLCFHILMLSTEIQVLNKWFPAEVPVLVLTERCRWGRAQAGFVGQFQSSTQGCMWFYSMGWVVAVKKKWLLIQVVRKIDLKRSMGKREEDGMTKLCNICQFVGRNPLSWIIICLYAGWSNELKSSSVRGDKNKPCRELCEWAIKNWLRQLSGLGQGVQLPILVFLRWAFPEETLEKPGRVQKFYWVQGMVKINVR